MKIIFFEVFKGTELISCKCQDSNKTKLLQIPERMEMNIRYWSYFSGFVGVHVCVKQKFELQGIYWNRYDRTSFNIIAICNLNMLFTYVWNRAHISCQDTSVFTMAQYSESDFSLSPADKY